MTNNFRGPNPADRRRPLSRRVSGDSGLVVLTSSFVAIDPFRALALTTRRGQRKLGTLSARNVPTTRTRLAEQRELGGL